MAQQTGRQHPSFNAGDADRENISAALHAAQEQLEARRRRHQRQEGRAAPAFAPVRSGRFSASEQTAVKAPTTDPDSTLGWESEALTRALRAAEERRQAAQRREAALRLDWLPAQPPAPQSPAAGNKRNSADQQPAAAEATISLLPDLALALLREGMAAPARVWLLLRFLDDEGAGWIDLATARARLTGNRAPLRICGWRQLRNLLREGEPTFWQRGTTRDGEEGIWLRSPARVAAALNLQRLKMRPVAVPVTALAESIGLARAHFYAAFHSGRNGGGPIARETLERLSGVSPRTQRLYEERTGVERHINWALGPAYNAQAAQERAWRHGHAIFRFTDHQGRHGPAGASYLAWQLPNSYSGPHSVQSRGRQKRINRQLVDLFSKGITGNGRQAVDAAKGAHRDAGIAEAVGDNIVRTFYANGQQAVKGYNRDPQRDAYWQNPDHMAAGGRRRRQVWRTIPGEALNR